jgi:uncharacterized protein (TIGR02145 family)
MFKAICFLITSLVLIQNLTAQQFGTLKNSRDGKIYKTVKIGEQVWMAENLNVSTFRNGDSIPHAATDQEWDNAGKEGRPAWCYYENNTNNGLKFGKLYNWYAVMDKRGLAPKGWHIAKNTEWEILIQYFGGVEESGRLKFNYESYPTSSQISYNTFWGNISGERSVFGFNNYLNFIPLGEDSHSSWWVGRKSKKDLGIHNYYQYLYNLKILDRVLDCRETEGHSVRCIKD